MKHAKLFEEFTDSLNEANAMQPSIKNLYNDKHAMQIKKALTFGVTPRDNSPARAILLSALEKNEPQDRVDSIKNVISILTQYLNDDIYINTDSI